MFKKLLIAFSIILFCSTFAFAEQVGVAWNQNPEPDLAGYKVYVGPSSGSYDTVNDVGNQTSYTIQGLVEGQTYHIAVTAYDELDNESGYSAEVVYTVPNVAPGDPTGLELVLDETSANIGVFLDEKRIGYILQESINLFPIGFKEYRLLAKYKSL